MDYFNFSFLGSEVLVQVYNAYDFDNNKIVQAEIRFEDNLVDFDYPDFIETIKF